MFVKLNQTTPVCDVNIASQIASLLNKHNMLTKTHCVSSISKDKGLYIVYLYEDVVAGCSAIIQENITTSRNYHTCVHENFRRYNIAKTLVIQAMLQSPTNHMFAIIRNTNVKSINLYQYLGFLHEATIPKYQYSLLKMGRNIR